MKKEINIARGKPSKEQLDLSNPLFMDVDTSFLSRDGIDVRNYGCFEGLDEIRELFADLLDVKKDNVIVCGNSSLNIMFDLISHSFIRGVSGSTPWHKLEKVKWLCLVPGYDRHFKITEYFGFEMINVPLLEDGPDMDMVEELVKDPFVKGMWCIPKYSNPSGVVYSNEVIHRLARLKPAAKDFRIYYDNAYFIHDLYGEVKMDNLVSLAEEYGNPNLVYEFISTSKITFPGSGLAAVIANKENIESIKNSLSVQTICFNKVNQYLHSKYFKTKDDVIKHMEKHAAILRPKFEMVEKVLTNRLTGLASWTHPRGGYFVTLYVDNLAKEVVEECKKNGLILTEAGCAFPYHNDPNNSVIRLAPTLLELDELKEALNLLSDIIIALKK